MVGFEIYELVYGDVWLGKQCFFCTIQSALCEYLLSMSACADALAPCHQHKDVKYYRR